MAADTTLKERLIVILCWCVLAPISIIAFILVLPFAALWFGGLAIYLRVWFWLAHRRHGKKLIFITSDSVVWSEQIQNRILDKVGKKALILNWSERKRWHKECPNGAKAHQFWCGRKNHVPAAIVFKGFWAVKVFRFYDAFFDWKHGKPETLETETESLLGFIPIN